MNALFSAGLLPGDDADWLPITTGESGATVLHDVRGCRYAKLVPPTKSADLAGERDRIIWLGEAGIPVSAVLDWRENDHGACLVTRAIEGIPAEQLDADALWRTWPSIANLVRELHSIDASTCPFDRRLATMVPIARTTVAENRVQVEFLPAELQQVPPAQVLQHLEEQLPRRIQQESQGSVVCHGDLCLPNILVDNETRQVSGLIDLGRLGRADPYADIALLLTNARETWPDERTARRADRAFTAHYGTNLDNERLRFYLLLDPLTWPAEGATV
jgi:streptomycin 3"-kinase